MASNRVRGKEIDDRLRQGGGLLDGEDRVGLEVEIRARSNDDRREQREGYRHGGGDEVEGDGLSADPAQLGDVLEGRGPADQGDEDERDDQQLEARQEDGADDVEEPAHEVVVHEPSDADRVQEQAGHQPAPIPITMRIVRLLRVFRLISAPPTILSVTIPRTTGRHFTARRAASGGRNRSERDTHSGDMNALVKAFLAGLQRRAPDPQLLATVGDPEPERAAEAFLAATEEEDLAPSSHLWVPALLGSARPGFGARCLTDLAKRSRERGVPLDLHRAPSLPRVLGASNFLARLLLRHPDWVAELEGDAPGPPADGPIEPDWTEIRRVKYRGLLRIAARDLVGRPFAESLRELSDLADRCLAAALACASSKRAASPRGCSPWASSEGASSTSRRTSISCFCTRPRRTWTRCSRTRTPPP